MSNYEFWKELGKIFNAVVAYQEKSIEFNKRFINPWIKIGNVFDTQDRHREAVHAYQQAVEMDPGNAQNWLELGNAHFRNETFEEAVPAFQKAIDLDPNLGWPYSNLALTYVLQNRHGEAKLLYEKSIQLLSDDKDKAVCWNRLGNLHRKLNEYDLAMQAFQKADELDKENAGFKDEFDEVLAHVDGKKEDETAPADMIANSIQLIVERNEADEKEISSEIPTQPIKAAVMEPEPLLVEAKLEEALIITPESSPTNLPDTESSSAPEIAVPVEEIAQPTVEEVVPVNAEAVETSATESEPVAASPEMETKGADAPELVEVPITAEKIETVLIENVTETFTESLVGMEAVTETFQAETPAVADVTEPVSPVQEEPVAIAVEDEVLKSDEKVSEPTPDVIEVVAKVSELAPEVVDVVEKIDDPAPEVVEVVAQVTEPAPEVVEVAAQVSEPAPEAVEIAAQVSEPAPEAVEVVAQVSEPAPEVAEVVEKVSEPAPEVVVEVAKVSEPAPEVVEVVAKVSEAALEVMDVNEKVTEPVAEPTPEVLNEKVDEPIATVAASEPTIETKAPEELIQEAAQEITSQGESVPEMSNAETVPQEENAEIQPVVMSEVPALNALEPDTLTPSILDEEPISSLEPITMVDETGEFQLEMDTKNAHVWNELGNVYFNRGSIDDAIVAYSKAIELDRWFAWPYSNLALAYVQKERFAEAMLLYQRSIELFTSNKDKAISWNRLGNVYRRLNDYDNAIASYQRADELDPDNSTIYLQSRFSLLGSYQVEQNASLSS